VSTIVGGKKLSKRLVEIVELSAEGYTDREISVALRIGTDTVETHWKRLRAIYDKSNRTGIVAAYISEKYEEQHEELRRELDEARKDGAKDSTEAHDEEFAKAVIRYRQFDADLNELVTLRKQAEFLDEIATSLQVVTFSAKLGPPHEIIFIKGSDDQAFGYDCHEFLGGTLRLPQIIHEDDLGMYLQSIEALLKGDAKSQEVVYRIKDKAGEYHWRLDFNSSADEQLPEGTLYHAASFWLDHRLLPGSQALNSLVELRGFQKPKSAVPEPESQSST
jgi:DNA-binding CsgD family transcriptional regulator